MVLKEHSRDLEFSYDACDSAGHLPKGLSIYHCLWWECLTYKFTASTRLIESTVNIMLRIEALVRVPKRGCHPPLETLVV